MTSFRPQINTYAEARDEDAVNRSQIHYAVMRGSREKLTQTLNQLYREPADHIYQQTVEQMEQERNTRHTDGMMVEALKNRSSIRYTRVLLGGSRLS
jgi:hypothetical protein